VQNKSKEKNQKHRKGLDPAASRLSNYYFFRFIARVLICMLNCYYMYKEVQALILLQMYNPIIIDVLS